MHTVPSREALLFKLRYMGTIAAVARIHGVHQETVRQWMKLEGIKRIGLGKFE